MAPKKSGRVGCASAGSIVPLKRCASRGSVRIFTTGVSIKRFLVMLETAYQAQFGGADVTSLCGSLSGLAATEPEQKRIQAGLLLRGFECLTPLAGTAVGRVKGWFDVAAAVTRAPDIVLIEARLRCPIRLMLILASIPRFGIAPKRWMSWSCFSQDQRLGRRRHPVKQPILIPQTLRSFV